MQKRLITGNFLPAPRWALTRSYATNMMRAVDETLLPADCKPLRLHFLGKETALWPSKDCVTHADDVIYLVGLLPFSEQSNENLQQVLRLVRPSHMLLETCKTRWAYQSQNKKHIRTFLTNGIPRERPDDMLSALERDEYMGVWTNQDKVRVLEPNLERHAQWNHKVMQGMQDEERNDDDSSVDDDRKAEIDNMVQHSFDSISREDMVEHWEYIKARYRFHIPTEDSWNSNFNERTLMRWKAWWNMLRDIDIAGGIDVHLRKHYDWLAGEEYRQAWMTFVNQLKEGDEEMSDEEKHVALVGLPVELFLQNALARTQSEGLQSRLPVVNGLIWSPKEAVLREVEKLDTDATSRRHFLNEATKAVDNQDKTLTQQQLRSESAFFTAQAMKRYYAQWICDHAHAVRTISERKPFVGVAVVELSALQMVSNHFFKTDPSLYQTMVEHFMH